jgi:tripartite-type tricarboxylate transporter receptor subunit TctC
MLLIIGPAGIPEDRVKKLHDGIKGVLDDPEFQTIAKNMGLELEYRGPEDVVAEIQVLWELYRDLVAAIG